MRLTLPIVKPLAVVLAAVAASQAQAVVAPSTFTNAIQVQGEAAGTEFDDWASAGIPFAVTDPEDTPDGLDLNTIQIANDLENIYLRITLHGTSDQPLRQLFLAFDTDQDKSTGFDIFGSRAIGSEVGYQSDFPFQQTAGTFNTGVSGVTDFGGDFIGFTRVFPFFDGGPPVGTQVEYAIPVDLAIGPTPPGSPVFGTSFSLMAWTFWGSIDVSPVIEYVLAVPEPSCALLTLVGASVLLPRRSFGGR